ncbi:lytic transglycosylase domain-containing protein, partial [Actinoalloteichus spitiensis]|uniref:lytic transglycosylase domain-containing protein n=1 Tax=Actinoalloteichus spitiensis TaxID=252394 RepID=UPI00035C1FA5
MTDLSGRGPEGATGSRPRWLFGPNGRPKLPVVVTAFAALLMPSAALGTATINVAPASAQEVGDVALPGPGGVLDLLREPQDGELYGAGGRLPAGDQVSPELLEELRDRGGAPGSPGDPFNDLPDGPLGIPAIVLDAYRRAERSLGQTQPGCGLHWSLLAGIGRIESGHARGGNVDSGGTTLSPILGPQLNGGPGIAAIPDTDGGLLDGDPVWDRAVGPMQFIPSTWAAYAADGNGDGVASPHNVYDAALAAGRYLCSGGLDLRVPDQLAAAVFRYNRSDAYVRDVLYWADAYRHGVTPLPGEGVPADPDRNRAPVAPPANPPGGPGAPGQPGGGDRPGTPPGDGGGQPTSPPPTDPVPPSSEPSRPPTTPPTTPPPTTPPPTTPP